MKTIIRLSMLVAVFASAGLPQAFPNLLQNGGLENVDLTFVNTTANYMPLGASSTAISGWTVAPGTTGQIVWAQTPTGDGYNAAEGSFFVDLSGFGASSSNGALDQMLHGLIIGESYNVSFDFFGIAALVKVDGADVAMGGYTSDPHGSVAWNLAYGSFVATSADMLFEVRNSSPGSTIDFIDNISVTGSTAVPDNGCTLTLLAGAALCLGGLVRCRPARGDQH